MDHRLSVAPMMERTDRHCRYLLRLAAPNARLYTEMVTAAAVVRGGRTDLLELDPSEHPVALQLGGSDPDELAAAARLGARLGYDEINLNVGCPSDRVQAGCFGAALMLDPHRVAASVASIRAAVDVPVTIKTRLGVDEHDSYEFLEDFIAPSIAAGCDTFVVHARKAWLKGLSPKQNREIPPLDYARVHRLKREHPELTVVINGGFESVEGAASQIGRVDGVMLGRAAYANPMLLAELDARLYGADAVPERAAVARRYCEYVARGLARGTPLRAMTRHLAGLHAGRPGGRAWWRALGELPDGHAGLAALEALIEQAAGGAARSARRSAAGIAPRRSPGARASG